MAVPESFLHIRWMTPRQKLKIKFPKLGSPARVAVLAMLIGVCALAPGAYADDPKAVPEAPGDSAPIRTSAQPPAKFFTINSVLAKLDRAGGRGKGAIRLASLKSWNTTIDASTSGSGLRSRHRAIWTVLVPRSRRFAFAQVAGPAIRYHQGREGSGSDAGRTLAIARRMPLNFCG